MLKVHFQETIDGIDYRITGAWARFTVWSCAVGGPEWVERSREYVNLGDARWCLVATAAQDSRRAAQASR